MREKFLKWLLSKYRVRCWLLKYYIHQVQRDFLNGKFYLSATEWHQCRKQRLSVEAINRWSKFMKKYGGWKDC